MTIPRLSYIAQLNLPGFPIKVGCTKNPWSRLDSFSHGTPVDCRFIGLTLDGIAREKEMLEATASAKIKGEWRYTTDALRKLVARYQAAGEWFTYCPDSFDEADIRARALALVPEYSSYLERKLSPRSVGYYWVNTVLSRAVERDPLLHVHWAGFRPSDEPPSFEWLAPVRLAA